MGALPIVKDFNVFEEGLPRFLSGMKIMAMDQFCFQRGDETLHRRIVPAIAFAAHRATDAILAQQATIGPACILAAPIRMVHQPGRGAPLTQRHMQGGLGQFLFHTPSHRPADHASSIQIQHHGQIQPALSSRDVGEIGHPFFIGPIRREITTQSIGGDGMSMPTLGRGPKTAPTPARRQAGLLHQARDAMTAYGHPLRAQGLMDRGLPYRPLVRLYTV